MIQAYYKNDESASVFYIAFSNVELTYPGYKAVSATYHLENAITKAIREATENKKTVQYAVIKVTDPKNDYLKLIAVAFAQFIKGNGISEIVREGF
jgi:hypothetical protein